MKNKYIFIYNMRVNYLVVFAALLMVCCIFFGCTSEEEKLGTIYGTVTDYSSGDQLGTSK